MKSFLEFLDKFFFVFHALFTLFCMLGWIWKATRKLNLLLLLLTGFSWFGLGVFYGWGYCPLTDWHWQVHSALGYTDFPRSYIKFFLDEVTGLDWNATFVDTVVAVCFAAALAASSCLNIWDYLKKKGKVS